MNETKLYMPDDSGYLSQDGTKSYYSRIGWFCFLIGAVPFAVSILASIIIQMFFPWIANADLILSIVNYAISFLGIYCIATPIAMLAIKPLPKVRPIKENLKFSHFLAALCICFTFMEVGSSISSMLLAFVQKITGLAPDNPVGTSLSTGNMLLNAVLVGIAFPILEEVVFRKLLCSRLLPLGEKKAVVISAAIFGLIHGNLYQFAYAFLLGLVFGYVYVKTGKIIYTIVFHCIINLYSGVFAQYVISKVPLDEISKILQNTSTDPNLIIEQLMPYASEIALYMAFACIMSVLSLAGFIILLVLTVKRSLSFEQGILQTSKENRISNFFLNSGVAAAIGFIAVSFFLSILE